jgi:RimJ/RimL family protein N-acetyltransferase
MLDTRQVEDHVNAGVYAEAELCDGSVGISPFRASDTAALLEAVRESVNEICAWMVWCRPDYSLADSASFISSCAADWREGRRYSFVIFDPSDGSFLGSVGLSEIHPAHKFANVGYWVRTGMTRRGVASAALRLAARFAFERRDLRRLDIVMPADNRASGLVAKKAGAKLEGLMRDRLLLGGKAHDALLYSLVRGDLRGG